MVSTLVEERFIDLLNEYGEAETKSEITRQVLFERRDYDSYSLYRRVLDGDVGGISRAALRTFLNDCNLFPLETDLDLLFWNLDKDGDGLLSWSEFLAVVVPKEHASITPQYGATRHFTLEAEHSLMRVFEQELANQRSLEDARKRLHMSSYTESSLFDLVDRNLNSWISLPDMEAFLKSRFAGSTFLKTERAFRRVDEDNDGRVIFEEFLRAVRPVYLYPTYVEYYNHRRALSPLRYKSSVLEEVRCLTPEAVRESLHRSRLLKTSYVSPRRYSPMRTLVAERNIDYLNRSIRRSVERRSSPLRKTLAEELRSDRLERSLRRSLTRYSPLRQTIAEELRDSRIALSPRRYSPLRKTVAQELRDERLERSLRRYSPLRKTLAEELRDSRIASSPRRYSLLRKTAVEELRDDRLERSLRRSLRRSTYVSPLRVAENERALDAAKFRNDVRLSSIEREGRFYSPSRGW